MTRRWSAGGRGQITDDVRAAIMKVPAWARTTAIDAAGGLRDGAQVAEVTGLLELTGWPQAMRVVLRRERPHPGAQLDAFEDSDGYRYQAMATNTRVGQRRAVGRVLAVDYPCPMALVLVHDGSTDRTG